MEEIKIYASPSDEARKRFDEWSAKIKAQTQEEMRKYIEFTTPLGPEISITQKSNTPIHLFGFLKSITIPPGTITHLKIRAILNKAYNSSIPLADFTISPDQTQIKFKMAMPLALYPETILPEEIVILTEPQITMQLHYINPPPRLFREFFDKFTEKYYPITLDNYLSYSICRKRLWDTQRLYLHPIIATEDDLLEYAKNEIRSCKD